MIPVLILLFIYAFIAGGCSVENDSTHFYQNHGMYDSNNDSRNKSEKKGESPISLAIMVEPTEKPEKAKGVRDRMINQFKDDLDPLEKSPYNCINIYCKKELLKYGKGFCDACYWYFRRHGKLRGKDEPISIINGPSRSRIKNKMINQFRGDLDPLEKSPYNCINRYCRKELTKSCGKYFCDPCYWYFRRYGKLKGKDESIKKKDKDPLFSFTNGPTKSKIKNKMINQFRDNLRPQDESSNLCRNMDCNRQLTKSRGKHFCANCYSNYLKTGNLKGKRTNSRMRKEKESLRPPPSSLNNSLVLRNLPRDEIEKLKRAALILLDIKGILNSNDHDN
jgi:hypothetical protein